MLLLQMLEPMVDSGIRVVDVGSGSGILAVAAARLGARVLAVDIDAGAVEVIRANVRRNAVDELVDVELASATDRFSFDADVALVNLTLDLHRVVADRLDRVPVVALSGILDEQADAAARLHRHRTLLRTGSLDGWTALVLGRG